MFEAFTLRRERVDSEEDMIRQEVRALPDVRRAEFHRRVSPKIKDPDTYAALNWFTVAGLHNFYLGQWMMGVIDLMISIVAVGFVITGFFVPGNFLIGFMLLLFVTLTELPSLFRSQIIVKNHNNLTARRILKTMTATDVPTKVG